MNHISQISALLDRYQLDGMLVTSSVNLQYALDRVVFAGAVLVTARGGVYVTDGPSIPGDPSTLTVTEVSKGEVYPRLAALTKDLGLRRLGFEGNTLPWSLYQGLGELTGCSLVPADGLLVQARMCKTPEEIARIKAVQTMTDDAYLEALPEIHAGMTEHEVAGLLAHRMLAKGGFTLAFPVIVASGPNGSDPHGFAGERVIQKGDFVTMDFGCVMDGYGSDMTRTVAIGSCTEEMKTVYDTVLAAQQAGIQAAHGGVTGQEIDAAGRAVIERAGYGEYFTHGFGHGLGIEGHESPGAGPQDITPLPAGAVVSAEPGIYIPGKFGVRIEDLIVITETGCEDLNHSSKELIIL